MNLHVHQIELLENGFGQYRVLQVEEQVDVLMVDAM
jgi:hypothetical protein